LFGSFHKGNKKKESKRTTMQVENFPGRRLKKQGGRIGRRGGTKCRIQWGLRIFGVLGVGCQTIQKKNVRGGGRKVRGSF